MHEAIRVRIDALARWESLGGIDVRNESDVGDLHRRIQALEELRSATDALVKQISVAAIRSLLIGRGLPPTYIESFVKGYYDAEEVEPMQAILVLDLEFVSLGLEYLTILLERRSEWERREDGMFVFSDAVSPATIDRFNQLGDRMREVGRLQNEAGR